MSSQETLFGLEGYNPPSNLQRKPERDPATMRALAIVGCSDNRVPFDFYPTPAGAASAITKVVPFRGKVWEPACGEGDLSRALEGAGYEVISTDLIDRGYGTPKVDFLKTETLLAPSIVTNPPFKYSLEFLEHALYLGASQVAFLEKLSFLEGIERSSVLMRSPLKTVFIFRDRVKFRQEHFKQGGMLAFAWFYWEVGYTGAPQIQWITSKPIKERTKARK